MTIYEYTFSRRRIAESPAVVRSPSDTLPLLRDLIADSETERLAVLWLDTKLHLIGAEVVYIGNVSAALVRVGELFRGAVRVNATAIILAHNHPSGDPTPSPDDMRLLDIELLDHLILGEEGTFTSLRDRGIPFDRIPRTGKGDPTC
jgi:DNA repair protein RadC